MCEREREKVREKVREREREEYYFDVTDHFKVESESCKRQRIPKRTKSI